MNVLPLLLRVLLCISLVADGAGYARASARMAFEHVGHSAATQGASTTQVDADADAPPCHRHVAGKASRADVAVSHADGADDSGDGASAGDCCKDKACRCACAHAACTTMDGLALDRFVAFARHPAVAVADHAQPRLPHLIRPPIG